MGFISVPNNMGGQKKLMDDCIWEYEIGSFQQSVPERNDMKTMGKAFYTSSYVCPVCRGYMLKANAGEYVTVKTTHGFHTLKSVFACEKCQMLYSALPGMNLSAGKYFVMNNKKMFKKTTDVINEYGISVQQLQGLRW